MSSPRQSVRAFCLTLLESGSLEAKLRPPLTAAGGELDDTHPGPAVRLDRPVRVPELQSRRGGETLPPRGRLLSEAAQVICLQRFAHHELLAVELFAWALLTWPDMPPLLRRGMLAALADEQRHLGMYLGRLSAHGSHLGEAPLSDYLWRHVPALRDHPAGPASFLAAMGLTFEQANLDFTLAYGEGFRAGGDDATVSVLARVHHDEIGHVRMAWRWLRRLRGQGTDPVALYEECVPFPLGAGRAKGHPFDTVSRRSAGLPEKLIEHVRRAGGGAGRKKSRWRERQARGALLWGNLGAENEALAVSAQARAAAHKVAELWMLLHGPASRLAGPGREEWQRPQWPETLGPCPDGPVWAWLEDEGRVVAWLATERARRDVTDTGLAWAGAAPDPVLGDKGWIARHTRRAGLLPGSLSRMIRVLTPEELRRQHTGARLLTEIRGWPKWTGGRAILKPRHGSSGRGRMPLERDGPVPAGRGLERMARRGGAVLEPWLRRLLDLSVQVYLERDGTPRILGTTRQLLTPAGIWRGNAGELTPSGHSSSGSPWDGAIRQAASTAAGWLARRGYAGPFGLDAFSYTGSSGSEELRPLVEINPRFTTGMVALGLLDRACHAGLPASATAWAFLASLPASAGSAAEFSLVDRPQVGESGVARDGVRLFRLGLPGAPRPPVLLLADEVGSLDRLLCRWGVVSESA
ncbi:MAG: DUF455 family protein [Acidobacteria bacterium]|nr:DUF455 family protein [Acidobacteriota bacterium]